MALGVYSMLVSIVALFALLSQPVARADARPAAPPSANAMAKIQSLTRLNAFSRLASKTSMASDLTSGGPYTVFAPRNAVFKELSAEQAKNLESDTVVLQAVRSHPIPHLPASPAPLIA